MARLMSNRLPSGRRLAALGLLGLCVVGSGCIGRIRNPELTLQAWSRAAESGDCDAMYGLLASEVRNALSEDEFLRRCTAQEDAMARQGREVADAMRENPPQVQASTMLGPFESLLLEKREDGWRLTGPMPLPAGADEPLAAIARLLERTASPFGEEYFAFFSADMRDVYLGNLAAIRDLLLAGDPLDIIVNGDTAQMQVGDYTVNFGREDHGWVITSINGYGGYEYDY
jgi:hypothetical protein